MYKKYKLHRKDNFKAQNPEMDLMKCISTTITSATKQQLTARGHIFHWSVRFTADFRDRKACLVEPAGRGFAAVLREREMTGKEQKEKNQSMCDAGAIDKLFTLPCGAAPKSKDTECCH